jgi:signal transduction histidine kinase
LIAIVGVGFVALIALAFVASRGVTTSLSELSHAAERIGAGELGAEVPVGGPREVRVLSETMRTMARSISQREEEMQVMLAGIAHEVRNPLGGIELFGGLLREDLEGDPRQKHVDRILKEIGVLGGVVSDFLDYARKRPMEKARIDVHELAEEIASVSQREAEAKQVRIGIEVERGLGADLDRDSIRRALLNLVKNAVQAAPENGQVTIRARGAGEAVELQVADDGPGIPPEKRDEVFRPFFTTKQKGTGLGLALVKKAVDAHGGSVRIEDHPGGGALVTLTLPGRGDRDRGTAG